MSSILELVVYTMYTLSKAKYVLKHVYKLFIKKRKSLSSEDRKKIQASLVDLQNAVLSRDHLSSHQKAKECEDYLKTKLRKSLFDHLREVFWALVFALFVGIALRQMWFELFQIPTGSMRPTLMEQDRLIVTKAQFSVNIPLSLGHFYFSNRDIERGDIVTFTGEKMDINNVHTMYFYIFPGYKQFIKRLVAKPGDVIYFYGGKMYGIDKNGKDITPLLNKKELDTIQHLPFITFEGKTDIQNVHQSGIVSPVIFKQYNMPMAKLYVSGINRIKYEMLYRAFENQSHVNDYYDLFGFKNFAMARLIQSNGQTLLELAHHPSCKTATLSHDVYHRLVPSLGYEISRIIMNDSDLQRIFKHLTTARFQVKGGYAKRATQTSPSITADPSTHYYPSLKGIPDGTYEFERGVARQIVFQGTAKTLPPTHPLNRFNKERLLTLFNIGMEFDTRFLPDSGYDVFSSRYAFFNNNHLYLMGQPLLKPDHSGLIQFINTEEQKQSSNKYYQPFIDQGPPLDGSGKLDIDFIKKHGLRVDDKHYLLLGDNYAMSGDSRVFGFVPAENLKGVPVFIFWPFGTRFGAPLQPALTVLTTSRLVIWSSIAILLTGWYLYYRKKYALPLRF